jgi:hypothetical protein
MVARTCLIVAAILTFTLPAMADDTGPDPKGKPTTYKTGSGKYAVWYDDAGWHIRLSAAKSLTAFQYKIEAIDGKFTSIKPYDPLLAKAPKGAKKGDPAPPGLDLQTAKTLDMSSKLGKGLESGFDLKLDGDATAIKFSLKVDDKDDADLIMIGAKGAHPKEATFEYPAKPGKK